MCTKFLYFWGHSHGFFATIFFSLSLSPSLSLSLYVNLFTFSQFLSPIIVIIARTSALFPAGAAFNFSRKAARISAFRLAAFFSRAYHRAVRLFPPLHSAAVYNDIAATKYLRDAPAGAASTARRLRKVLFVYVKRAYSRVLSTPSPTFTSLNVKRSDNSRLASELISQFVCRLIGRLNLARFGRGFIVGSLVTRLRPTKIGRAHV